MAGLSDRGAAHHFDNCAAEIGEVVGLAARDEVAVDNDGSVAPNSAGIDEVVFDAGRTGDVDPAIDAGGDWDPATVADGGNELFAFGELAHQAFYFVFAAEFIGHEAAGDDDAVKIFAFHKCDGGI